MGKTETIKQRALYIYLPSLEMTKRWKDLAEKQGTSISKFIAEHVENSLRQETESGYKSRGELAKDLHELREELEAEKKKNRRLDIVVDKLEMELRKYRAQPFLDVAFEGVRRLSKELVDALRDGGVLSNEELLSKLSIDFSEHEAVKAVSKQLEILESYGLVQSTARGWRWKK